jgi:hypothetical protein
MADAVSWLMIEPGWRVVDATGGDAGRVEAITGDSDADIFDGLAIASDMLAHPKYVPAERVDRIENGVVHLALDTKAITALGEYEEPAESIEVEPEPASRFERIEQAAAGPDPREHREGVIRRIAAWLGLAGRR